MNAKEIMAVALLGVSTYIEHKSKFTEYRLRGKLLVKINGVWIEHIMYMDINTRELYARTPDDFDKFKLVK